MKKILTSNLRSLVDYLSLETDSACVYAEVVGKAPGLGAVSLLVSISSLTH